MFFEIGGGFFVTLMAIVEYIIVEKALVRGETSSGPSCQLPLLGEGIGRVFMYRWCNQLGANNLNSVNLTNTSSSNRCGCGSLQEFLTNSVGCRCTCFIGGTNTPIERTGILSDVGEDYITLESLNNSCNRITFDISRLIFVQFTND